MALLQASSSSIMTSSLTCSFSSVRRPAQIGARAPGGAMSAIPQPQRTFRAQFQRRSAVAQAAKTSDASPTNAGTVTDDTFEKLVLQSKTPVLVDFWAPWCGPCRMIAPLIDEIATEYGDKLTALKLNTDESPGIATEYGIRSIPTVMIFKDGVKQETVIGAVPKSTLSQTIDKYVD